jgi:hypothetical protein
VNFRVCVRGANCLVNVAKSKVVRITRRETFGDLDITLN